MCSNDISSLLVDYIYSVTACTCALWQDLTVEKEPRLVCLKRFTLLESLIQNSTWTCDVRSWGPCEPCWKDWLYVSLCLREREGERQRGRQRERISFLAINSNYINPNNQSLF